MDKATSIKIESIEERIDDHHYTLYGNGKPGLKADVQELKTTLKVAVTLLKWQIGIMVPFVVCGAGAILTWVLGKV